MIDKILNRILSELLTSSMKDKSVHQTKAGYEIKGAILYQRWEDELDTIAYTELTE